MVGKTKCGTVKYLPGMHVYPISCKGAKGRKVRIIQAKNYLTLAEVQVFGTGGPGPKGSNIGSGAYTMLLSQNKKTTQSSMGFGGVASRATDGSTDGFYPRKSTSHSGKNKNNWLKVDLYKSYKINMIILYNRADGSQSRINNAEVYVGKKKVGTVRYNPKMLFYIIPCDGAQGSFVKVVQKTNWLHLAEIQVFGGAKGVKGLGLLSQGKPTKQKDMGWGGISKRAVDGNANGLYASKTSTHSKTNKNNWWQVDLGKSHPVYMVLIHNRLDKCCRNRINGAQVKFSCRFQYIISAKENPEQ